MKSQSRNPEEQLLEELTSALAATDPVPARFVDAAKMSFTWRTIDAELAELVFDSAETDLAGVRGVDGTRQVTFRAPAFEIEVAIIADGSRRLIGQLVPAHTGTVELRFADTTVTTESDELGRFSFEDVPLGPISLRVELTDGAVAHTEWTLV